ncbi:PDZ domain-containing protein GIPC3 [Leptopilina heterotoma]|uniref:PDZ domain-containing protein GIPC3 n=1 Tax=Leptopilina heterotoma TaxID=63436 RepID=UPI001CA96F89|nr:PDZ domain-containing protein GIPC3 [Leptopilina heterotoma]XP_043472903.1 PDZ domain-containing protein GIPC3 [Leptopilina heterotoma]
MPLFKHKASSRTPEMEKTNNVTGQIEPNNINIGNQSNVSRNNLESEHQPLEFHCQMAHGSSTKLISGFSNVRELYQKIGECYDIPSEEIIFCTLNTHKAEMSQLLGGQIGLDDFIFAHRKGQSKEIELVKSDNALGLTITDNGAGYAFIKRIKEGSVIDKVKVIEIGDHIEKINSTNLVGKRHFEVAKMLKEIPKGSLFTLRLVEPLKSDFEGIGPRGDFKKSRKPIISNSGKETLRFKADGSVKIEKIKNEDIMTLGVEKINTILESFMGINDTELATRIWELSDRKRNSMEFAEAIDNSDLEAFGFTDDFVIELWGAITDIRSNRHI